MSDDATITKERLLDGLRTGREDALQAFNALPDAEWEKGRYENGWNARQILAHVASIEWTYPRLIDIAKGVEPPKPESQKKPGDLPSRTAAGGILSYNDRQVARREGVPVPELIDEWRANRDAVIAAVEAVDEDLLQVPIRSAGGITGPLATVIYQTAVLHVRVHVNDITGA